jgi:ribosome-associated heat shock protein Hsp15
MRLDLWLWAIRVYKTRTTAVTAIRAGHVQLNGTLPKPAREVHPADIIIAQVGDLTRTLRAKGAPKSRIGAPLVPEYAEDLTPPQEYRKQKTDSAQVVGRRPRGSGRPTKRDRRQIEEIMD